MAKANSSHGLGLETVSLLHSSAGQHSSEDCLDFNDDGYFVTPSQTQNLCVIKQVL